MIPSLKEDCAQCAALCCLALSIDKGEHFAINKPAGVPCPNLDGHGCSIHRQLRTRGFSGCTIYSCGGAGQRVTQELFAGQSWRDDRALTVPMMEAFRGMRAIQDRLAILCAAQDNLALDAADGARVREMIGWLLPEALDFDKVRFFPESVEAGEIDLFLPGLRRYVTGRTIG